MVLATAWQTSGQTSTSWTFSSPVPGPEVKNIKHSGNVSKDTIFNVARQMRFKSQAKEFKGTVKEMLGTAFAVTGRALCRDPSDAVFVVQFFLMRVS